MTRFTSFIPPGSPISDPPDPIKVIGAILSVLLSVLFVGFIVFLCAEFILDQIGMPIRRESADSSMVSDSSGEDQIPQRRRLFTPEEIQSQFRIVTPPDQAHISGNWITVLCHWTPPEPGIEDPPVQPQLFFDEALVPWTMHFGTSAWLARFKAESGEHRLRVLDDDLTVFVHEALSNDSGPNRKRLILHEGTDDPARCGECHVVIQGSSDVVHKSRGLTIGPLRPSESCFDCHSTEAVNQRHAKLAEWPGKDCATCHRLHGEQPNSAP